LQDLGFDRTPPSQTEPPPEPGSPPGFFRRMLPGDQRRQHELAERRRREYGLATSIEAELTAVRNQLADIERDRARMRSGQMSPPPASANQPVNPSNPLDTREIVRQLRSRLGDNESQAEAAYNLIEQGMSIDEAVRQVTLNQRRLPANSPANSSFTIDPRHIRGHM
jgi:hypothetical protein